MIKTKEQLDQCLATEKEFYVPRSFCRRIKNRLRGSISCYLWRYIKALRKMEYYHHKRAGKPLYAFMYYWYSRVVSRVGMKLGIEADAGVFAEGLRIYHPYGIVINGDAKVGKNCILHGNNVIGNMGNDLCAPVIGDNVRLGAGAKVLGGVTIADNVQIGAGSLVIHSCTEEGALLIGFPARVHRSGEQKSQQ